jgi:micrococcal nuclease
MIANVPRHDRVFVGFLTLNVLCLPPATACSLPEGSARAVVSVIDGDTLILDDHSKLRLIGAMRPAPPTAGTSEADWPLAAATRDALERYTRGQSLLLEQDKRTSDRYGQLLAQAFIVSEQDQVWLQGRLVQEGLARAYSFPDNRGCAAELIALEATARRAHRGLWANAAYAVRPAETTRELLRYVGSYQLVEGTVATAFASKGRVYLDFGADWKTDFTASVDTTARKEFESAGLDPAALKGQRIRVRGWIESLYGPQIRVTHPEQIEIIADDGTGAVISPDRPVERPADTAQEVAERQ